MEHGSMNQLANCHNYYQGKSKRALFLCSAGLLRSPTAAHLFSQAPYNWNTRAAGTVEAYALIPVSHALVEWADVIYVMTRENEADLRNSLTSITSLSCEDVDQYMDKVINLNIPDDFAYGDKDLQNLLRSRIDNE